MLMSIVRAIKLTKNHCYVVLIIILINIVITASVFKQQMSVGNRVEQNSHIKSNAILNTYSCVQHSLNCKAVLSIVD